jgi:hypothetical protein
MHTPRHRELLLAAYAPFFHASFQPSMHVGRSASSVSWRRGVRGGGTPRTEAKQPPETGRNDVNPVAAVRNTYAVLREDGIEFTIYH